MTIGHLMTLSTTLAGTKLKKITFSNLKPSVKKISLRLPETMIEELKLLANKRDVPYQSLLKIFLAERIEKELGAH
jgi:predicted DNA binding CopG/RHH family protein